MQILMVEDDALVLVRLDHVASSIVNANHSAIGVADCDAHCIRSNTRMAIGWFDIILGL